MRFASVDCLALLKAFLFIERVNEDGLLRREGLVTTTKKIVGTHDYASPRSSYITHSLKRHALQQALQSALERGNSLHNSSRQYDKIL